jgi:hypothetical protein
MDKQFLKDIAPYIGPYLIILGMLKLDAYYSYFGIPILQYIEITEVLLLLLQNIVLVIVLLGAQHLILTIFVHRQEARIILTNKYSLAGEARKKRVMGKRSIMTAIMVVVIINAISYWQFRGTKNPMCFISGNLKGVLIITFIVLAQRRRTGKLNDTWFLVGCTIILALWFACAGLAEAVTVDIYRKSRRYDITFSDKTAINSGDSIVYLGKSKNYLFFYNWKHRMPEVYPAGKVDKIQGMPVLSRWFYDTD